MGREFKTFGFEPQRREQAYQKGTGRPNFKFARVVRDPTGPKPCRPRPHRDRPGGFQAYAQVVIEAYGQVVISEADRSGLCKGLLTTSAGEVGS